MIETIFLTTEIAGRTWVIRYYAERTHYSAATYWEPSDETWEFMHFEEDDLVDEGVELWMPDIEDAITDLCKKHFLTTSYSPGW